MSSGIIMRNGIQYGNAVLNKADEILTDDNKTVQDELNTLKTSLNDLIAVEVFSFPANDTQVTAGAVGTRAKQLTANATKEGYNIISATIASITGNSTDAHPLVFFSNNILYLNLYRTITTAGNIGAIYVSVVYKKI